MQEFLVTIIDFLRKKILASLSIYAIVYYLLILLRKENYTLKTFNKYAIK